jgi:hypothetical protein
MAGSDHPKSTTVTSADSGLLNQVDVSSGAATTGGGMTQFIHTEHGYRRLSDVKMDKIDNDGNHVLRDDENNKISEHGEVLLQRIISIIPPSGEWEQVYTCKEEDGATKVYSEPVIAWGLTTVGSIVPVTPTAPEGVPNGAAVRKVGRPEIYVGSTTHTNEEDWLRSGDA